MTRRRWVLVAVVILLLLVGFSVVAVGGESQEDELVQITQVTLQDQTVEKDGPFQVRIEYENVSPDIEFVDILVTADGIEVTQRTFGAAAGGGEEVYTFYATIEPGTYTIEIEGETAGELTVEEPPQTEDEESWPQMPLFGTIGLWIGFPTLILGTIFYFSSVGIELLRGFKHYFGSGTEYGHQPAALSGVIGSALLVVGGVFIGDFYIAVAMIGGFSFVLFTGILAVEWVYKKL